MTDGRLRRALRIGGGCLLLCIGVIGGFIPVLQGWMFVLAGLTLMAPESRRIRRLLEWAKLRAGVPEEEDESAPVASRTEKGRNANEQ